ncbi:Aspartic proteinase CDR1, partial [Linum grandiflorum]
LAIMTATTLALHLAFIFLFSSLQSSNGLRFTTRLIHRDSHLSPVEPIADRAVRSLQSSVARYAYISSLKGNPHRGADVGLVEAVNDNIFYVNFSIGNPPVPQLAVMDTTSDLLWIKCLPCSPCSPTSGITFFDPTKSNTFRPRPCTKGCRGCTRWFSKKVCKYKISYLGTDFNEGILAREHLTFHQFGFGASDIIVPNLLFGCSSLVTEDAYQNQYYKNGVLTLGFNKGNSLVARLGSKFSYCVGSVVDRSYPYNRLDMGQDAYFAGNSTTLYINPTNGLYFAFIANITLGGQALDIGKELIAKMSHEYGVVMDSGAEFSYLYAEVFDAVKAAVSKMGLTMLVEVPAKSPYELCYKGSVYRAPLNFPAMGIQFEEGVELVLDNFGMFVQVEDDAFCFAFLRAYSKISYIGMMAQQGYNIGYDLDGKRLHIQEMDCEILG